MNSRQLRVLLHEARKLGTPIDPSELKRAMAREQAERKELSSQAQSQKEKWPILRRFWGAVSVLGVLVGLLGAYQLRPALSVELDQSFDPKQPFGTPLTFTNVGPFLTLRDVRFGFNINLTTKKGVEMSFRSVTPEDALAPGDPITKIVPVAFGPDGKDIAIRILDNATPTDMRVFVHFKVWCWPTDITKQFRFKTITRADGNMQWIRSSISN
jgi:hypothetical protein